MPVIVSPLFWEWFNIWLVQFLKDLYHEIKMVALRGGNSSLNAVNHGCGVHGGQQGVDASHNLQVSLGMHHGNGHQSMGHHHPSHASHASHGGQPNVQSLNSISLQFVPQQPQPTLKHEQNSRYTNSNCMQPSHHYRLLTQSRPECYHPSGAGSGNYISSAAGAQNSQALRGQAAPQPSAPPAPQQDMSKTTMAGPSYVTQQNQSQQARTQYANFQYRGPQHGTRPTPHPRQQQPYLSGAGATATGPVMFHPLVFQPPHMGIQQTYQPPRSSTPGYFPYMTQYIGYPTSASPGPPYYYPNGQQLSAGTVGTNPGRSNPGGLVPQQVTAPATPATQLPHPQTQPHIHPTISGIRPGPTKRTSKRLAIIDPLTRQDILREMDSNDNNQNSSEQSERQTPQPDNKPSVAEEFTRMVNEVANQPSSGESASKWNYSKTVEVPATTTSSNPPHTNTINSLSNSIVKSDLENANESKNSGPEVIESNETPIVSAISDSPVVVPKMSMNVKQLQKGSEQIQPLAVDNNKNITSNKQQKQNKSKPFVPQDELEKQPDSVNTIVPQVTLVPHTVVNATIPIDTNASFATSHSPASQTASVSYNEESSGIATGPVPVEPETAASTPATSTASVLQLLNCTPQPQRVKEPRERRASVTHEKSQDKEKSVGPKEKEVPEEIPKPNGPTSVVKLLQDGGTHATGSAAQFIPPTEVSSVDSITDTINPPTNPVNQTIEPTKVVQPQVTETEKPNLDKKHEVVINKESTFPTKQSPTATELLSASIEKVAKEQPFQSEINVKKEESSAIQAQAKLAHSIASVTRNHSEPKMKDINLNNKPADTDTANGNTTVETAKDEVNKNEKAVKNAKNHNKKSNKMANNEVKETKVESYENGKDETDKISKAEQENVAPKEEPSEATEKPAAAAAPAVFVPKYKYSDDQWSPLNKSGKKHYDIDFLMQIKEDPLSKNKPNVPLLEACNVMRTTPIQEPMIFNPITRPMNDAFYPNFLKVSGVAPRNNVMKEPKKDGRSMPQSGKGSAKLAPSSGGGHKPVIHVSLSLREEVKLNQTKDAWRPARFKKESLTEEEAKTQELYKKFRGILNKLTPQKFDTLLERVKALEINTKSRLEGVIDLIFEKAIDEPNFSEAYAAMCNKLSMIKVPTNCNSPDQWVNFRILIISRCQNQFEKVKVDEQVQKLEKEVAECTDPAKKKELLLQLEEENRRMRMRSVGNIRFIGELYKLKMLTAKIMVICMNSLIDKLEEEKLECLCKLLTTIGEQVESEVKDQLENVFKKMQDIVERKSDRISSRVRFMLQDVIELKRRKWVTKNVVDSQPKMMDQIQKEAEQQQRHIELMNSSPMGGFRREDGGRNKRGEGGRRQGNNTFMDAWKPPRTSYTVDTSKLKAVTQKSNVNTIKLAPHNSAWNQGSGTKNTAQASSTSMISLTKNMYSALENVQTDPTTLRTTKDLAPSYHHSKSIERSTFNSRGDFNNGSGSRSGSVGVTRSNSGSRSLSAAPTPAPEAASTTMAQEQLSEDSPLSKKVIKMITYHLDPNNPNADTLATDFANDFPQQYHAGVVTKILNIAVDRRDPKDIQIIVKLLTDLVVNNTISAENFSLGLTEILNVAHDLKFDIPMVYEHLGKFIAAQIEMKCMTFDHVFRISEKIIAAEHGHLILGAIIECLKENMGPSFVKTKWNESGLKLSQWMNEDLVPKWIDDNKFEFLEGGTITEENIKMLTPAATQSKLLQLMNSEESCETIQGWMKDNIGASHSEDWFLRALSQAICEYALYGSENRDVPHLSLERMNKYSPLIINELSESKVERETSCLFGIQQLIHRLEHPQGLTLEIFQYLHEQYIISVEGFIAWEVSEKEPEGKAVMLKALTSFFTSIKEADNEDSCGDD